ncbi:MAG: hypothetical protein UY92_C0023G0004 [Candidatus Magasanikbacteria bacterium GW2011_GWA2_56_11]|uniref:Uncharacterized protein n=1 Tax=Candidatus Magasanikbacteria bacterium GW2011_GWA2_56_11 TaxID=1619044 RepID=A0A0G1YDR7_9BACT|nr:MAG: hypothetical protein UY92_C0023G0004 [Candidatus Magasanikbacteria bacterium GW2011_GWA2_56_11]
MQMSDHLIDIVEIAKRAGQVILDYYAKDQYAVWSKPAG